MIFFFILKKNECFFWQYKHCISVLADAQKKNNNICNLENRIKEVFVHLCENDIFINSFSIWSIFPIKWNWIQKGKQISSTFPLSLYSIICGLFSTFFWWPKRQLFFFIFLITWGYEEKHILVVIVLFFFKCSLPLSFDTCSFFRVKMIDHDKVYVMFSTYFVHLNISTLTFQFLSPKK